MLKLKILIHLIDIDNREKCLKLLDDNRDRIIKAQGSSHNHQAWEGGYVDHITEVMTIATHIYNSLSEIRSLPFKISDALLVLFLHDLEKPWNGEYSTNAIVTKAEKKAFREAKIAEYKFSLNEMHRNALTYVEGEGDDYLPGKRVMNELAAFCHMCDVCSARIWWDQPRE